jgi:hypothetical protein
MRLVDDGRSSQAVQLRRTRDQLLAALPTSAVTSVSVALAERCAILSLHISEMDREALAGGGMSSAQLRVYSGLCGHHARALKMFWSLAKGAEKGAPAAAAADLQAHVARHVAEKGALLS